MSTSQVLQLDPELDLSFEREVDVTPEQVWAAWTQPEHVRKWFTPRPWTTTDCEIDLRPGGMFRTVMRSPEGESFPHVGCYLEVVPNERLVWTSALLPGYRPAPDEDLPFTAIISLRATARGTRYTAAAIHRDVVGRQKHEAMGFREGWGKALDQLVAFMKTM